MRRLFAKKSSGKDLTSSTSKKSMKLGFERIDELIGPIGTENMILIGINSSMHLISFGFSVLETLLSKKKRILWAEPDKTHYQTETQFINFLKDEYFLNSPRCENPAEPPKIQGRLFHESIIPGQEEKFFHTVQSAGKLLDIDLVIMNNFHKLLTTEQNQNRRPKQKNLLQNTFETIMNSKIPIIIFNKLVKDPEKNQKKTLRLGNLCNYELFSRYCSQIILLRGETDVFMKNQIIDTPVTIPLNKSGRTGETFVSFNSKNNKFIRNDHEMAGALGQVSDRGVKIRFQ